MITVVLVDDHPAIRRGLRALLETQRDFQVVGETGNGFEAVQMIKDLQPKIATLDLMIEGISGIEVARQVNHENGTSVVIFSVLYSEHYALEALRSGVKGYILKESSTDEVLDALREVAAGRRYLCPKVMERALDLFMKANIIEDTDNLQNLTAREREVLYLSAQGKTAAEMAKQLYVSRRTVETQRARMMRKLGLRNQHELISFTVQKGIVVPELNI